MTAARFKSPAWRTPSGLLLAALLAPTTLLPLQGATCPAGGASHAPWFAQSDENFSLEGKISKRSPGKLTISTGENVYFRVSYSEKTKIQREDGSAASDKDLRVGEAVRVAGDLSESGEVVAAKIVLLAGKEAPRK